MANWMHLRMLRLTQNDWLGKGMWRFVWDVWRKNNPGKRLNLRDAWLWNVSLWGLDLTKVDFSNANLSHAHLIYANLSQADLSNTNLLEANLSNANLSGANLSNANLLEANLEGANLSGANFSGAKLIKAHLSNADLTRANLIGAELGLASLRNASLRGANLVGADLTKVNLIDANLCEANLEGAYLEGAELIRTNLIRANFKKACLFRTQVLDADFSSGNLTGACIESWNINSATNFEELECDHVYLKCESGEFTLKFSDRRPSDPDANFASGEFVTLVKRSLETIDLIFVDGIDWKAFFDSFQELRWQYSDDDIDVQTIERKGESFVIRLESEGVTDKAILEAQAKEFYSKQLKLLEAQYEHKLQLQGANLEDARRTIETERHEKATLIGVISTMASNQQGPTYNINQYGSGDNVGGDKVEGDKIGTQVNNSQDLAQAARDIKVLLDQLSVDYPSDTPEVLGAKAVDEVKKNPELKSRIFRGMKAGGFAALEKMIDHPVAKFFIEGAKEALKS